MTEGKGQMAMEAASRGRVIEVGQDSVADIPSFYFNSMELGITLTDVNMTLFLDGVRKSRLHMSYTTAKTLMVGLQQLIKDFENASDHTIMTMTDTNEAFASLQMAEDQQEEK